MNYEKLGLKVGLEIHQQLATEHKLFCKCPIVKSIEFPIVIRRKLRPVSSELGDTDPAAQYEYLRNRNFIYKSNPESGCLIEHDESPPLDLNLEALQIAIQACKLLECDLVNELHVMRKTVIDGSSVSGFQRTVLIGTNGSLDTSQGKVGIETICLEEDSATVTKTNGRTIEYRLDRLGIPLIEIATSADITTPEQAHEVAEKLGLILRSLKVVRGIGSIRQDVNISIRNGARVEVKGFQELGKMRKLVESEAQRQQSLIRVKEELHKRGVKSIGEPTDVTNMFKTTKNNRLRTLIRDGRRIHAVKLPGFSGLLKQSLGAHTLGRELSFYAEAYGSGIIHTDEDVEKYNLSVEFREIGRKLSAGARDAIIISAGEQNAINAVVERARLCLIGVPEETRVSRDSDSRYSRPLPGSGRMYPETDVRPIQLTKQIRSVKLPKTLIEAREELAKRLPADLAEQMIKSKYYSWFEALGTKDPVFVANTFLSTFKDLRRSDYDIEKIKKDDVEALLKLVQDGQIPKNSMRDALIMIIEGKDISQIKKSLATMSETDLREIISFALKEKPDEKDSVLMRIIMAKTKGRASGAHVARLLREMK